MDPADERSRMWTAIGTASDRITGLEAIVSERNEVMRESIQSAVREAMPVALMSDDEHRWVKMSIEREAKRAQFRQKVIDSSTFWAVPTLLGLILVGGWTVVREYFITHGVWKP